PRRPGQLRQHRPGDPAGAVAAPSEPHRVDSGIIGVFDEGRGPAGVIAAEMAVLRIAGRMDDRLDRSVRHMGRKPRLDSRAPLPAEARTGVDDADSHGRESVFTACPVRVLRSWRLTIHDHPDWMTALSPTAATGHIESILVSTKGSQPRLHRNVAMKPRTVLQIRTWRPCLTHCGSPSPRASAASSPSSFLPKTTSRKRLARLVGG